MNFFDAVKSCFSKYVVFSGRARRSEYWYFTLFVVVVSIPLGVLDALFFGATSGISPLTWVFSLATILPSIAVSARRLHDIGRSAWWILIAFTIIGAFVLLFWAVQNSEAGENKFGANPKGE